MRWLSTEHEEGAASLYPLCVTLAADPRKHQTEVSQTNTVRFMVIYCTLKSDFSFIQEMLLSAVCERMVEKQVQCCMLLIHKISVILLGNFIITL